MKINKRKAVRIRRARQIRKLIIPTVFFLYRIILCVLYGVDIILYSVEAIKGVNRASEVRNRTESLSVAFDRVEEFRYVRVPAIETN